MISTRFNPIGKNFGIAGTSFEVTTTSDNTIFSFASNSKRTLATGSSSYTIDWGDGTIDTYTDVGTLPSHSYATGKYIVTISDDLSRCYTTYMSLFSDTSLVTRAISWGSKLEYVGNFYNNCRNLTGTILEWNDVITDAGGCYSSCFNLTGTIPKWNNTITDASFCYSNCRNLTGTIPKWNNTITDAQYCYNGCSNLTGIWDENATDEEIMPSHITSYIRCVYATPNTLQAYFYESWGGTKVA